jgi:hypothetical protein
MGKDDFMETKGERREEKRKRAWYKQHLASNRKSLNIIIQARLKRIAHDWYEVVQEEVVKED